MMEIKSKSMKTKNPFHIFVALFILAILFIFVAYPAFRTMTTSLYIDSEITLKNYMSFFSTEGHRGALINTITLGFMTVIVCGITGTLLAFFINFFDLPLKRLFDKLLLLPMVLPGLIIVFAFVQLYGESGIITRGIMDLLELENVPYKFSGFSGILFVHCYTQYVYFYMNVSVAIKHMDKSLIESARNMGASNFKIFIDIIIPFLKPALIASAILTFMTGIGSFSAPSIIGGSFKVMTTQILLAKANNYMDIAASQVVLLTIIAVSYLGMAKYYERKIIFKSSLRAVAISPIKVEKKWQKVSLISLMTIIVLLIILPVIAIIVLSFVKPGTWMVEIYPREFSFENYIRIFSKRRGFEPFRNSVSMSFISGIFSILLAVPVSHLLIKTKSRLKGVVEFLVMLPFAMPSSAIAINMINAFSKNLVGTYIILPIAYFVSLLPLMVRSTNISFYQLNDGYIEASKNLGASDLRSFFSVSLPIISPGIIAGFLLVFIRGLGEYTISVFLFTPGNRPISIAMVNSIFDYKIGLAMAYGSLIVVMCFILTGVIRKLQSANEK